MIVRIAGLGAIVGVVAFAALLLDGPRMREQPSLRTYEWLRPLPPAGSVPREPRSRVEDWPADGAAEGRADRGRVYYGYYCRMCHGEPGGEVGPVGTSYVPKPPDPAAVDLSGRDDAEVLEAILRGTGHEPVLEKTVRPAHWADLVRYVRDAAAR